MYHITEFQCSNDLVLLSFSPISISLHGSINSFHTMLKSDQCNQLLLLHVAPAYQVPGQYNIITNVCTTSYSNIKKCYWNLRIMIIRNYGTKQSMQNITPGVLCHLTVPVTSVSSKRSFLKAGTIMSDRCSNSTPYVAKLCFPSQWWSSKISYQHCNIFKTAYENHIDAENLVPSNRILLLYWQWSFDRYWPITTTMIQHKATTNKQKTNWN